MAPSTLKLAKKHVAHLGTQKAQWALKRVHCANMSQEKRAFWEKVWTRWVMLVEPEKTVPDLNVLDQLFMKHMPVTWDSMVVKLCEMTPGEFRQLTGMDRTRANLTLFVKWMAILFAVCDAAVVQLQEYGFYKTPHADRKRGDPPAVEETYVEYGGQYDLLDFGKAIVWMQTPVGPDERPFWWCASEKANTGNMKPNVLAALRDKLTLR